MGIQSESTAAIEPRPPVTFSQRENELKESQRATSSGEKNENPNDKGCPPIAIVGMALRLPGGVKSPDELWKFLIEKKNGVCEVPGSRYTVDSFYSDQKTHCVKTRHGYYLQEDPACFDASFFSINGDEAGQMDPQQRKLMEVLWECLESAGETDWKGKNIGCYVGVYGEDWLDLASKDPQYTTRYHILGTGQFALSNRLSWEYDFRGPSMTIQTGCSASLVGLHEACQDLYSGECCSAIVAGTNLIFAPTMTTTMSDNTVMSPTGTCQTFDKAADGYGRAEAITALYIKTLDDAIKNNDPIRGIIRATSVNFDGRTPTITTPGSESQEALVRRAYERAGINDISQTGFFECHGTGTVAGDTVEASVVAKLFEGKGVFIGGIKPNVGHGEGASGITSVIKGVMSLEHSTIPPNVFFESPNPNIPFKGGRLQVPLDPIPWPENRSKRVSVNSFGVGGANAHAILESAASFCEREPASSSVPCDGPRLLTVSARNAESLKERINMVTQYINEDLSKLHDLAYTLGVRREHLSHRSFIIAQPNEQIDTSKFQSGQDKSSSLTFVFTGQGAQWPEELSKLCNESKVNEAEFSQPLCTALQIALVNILYGWGIKPSSVVGHSSGEITAAYAAGAITSESAIIIAYYRGKVTKELIKKGAMAAVGLGRDQVTPYLVNGVVISCENSPLSVTLSGDAAAVDNVMESIKSDLPDAFCRQLRVSVAYHSHHMRELGPSYESLISGFIEYNENMLPLFSSVTSKTITEPRDLNAAYWRSNLESPVLFSTAIQGILQGARRTTFLEIGPHGALSGPLRQIFQASSLKSAPVYISTLDRNNTDSRSQLLHTAGSAHISGTPVTLKLVNGNGNTLGNIPPYPWQHNEKYWYASRLTHDWRFRAYPHHEILGSRVVETSDIEPSWRNVLRLDDVPWLIDHTLQGKVIFPATGYISIAGEAIRQLHPHPEEGDYTIKNFIIKTPLILKEERETEIITALKPVKVTDIVDSEWYSFTIMAHDGTGWTKHCQGQVRAGSENPPKGYKVKTHSRTVDVHTCYKVVDRLGFNYGPHFRRFQDISVHPAEDRASATVLGFQGQPISRYTLHPATMDHVLQLWPITMAKGLPRSFRLMVPATFGEIYVRGSSSQLSTETIYTRKSTGVWMGQAIMMAGDELILSMSDCTGFPVDGFGDVGASEISLCSQIRWAPDIDLLPSQALLATPSAPECYRQISSDVRQLSFLYILETADIVANIIPSTPFLDRWRNWIMSEASRVRQYPDTLSPEMHDWVTMSSEARKNCINTVSSRYSGEKGELSIPVECMKHIYESCRGFLKENCVLDETLDCLKRYWAVLQSHCDWRSFLTLLAHSNPSMRVLEIGAGTGSATRAVLQHLVSPEGARLYSKYTFTDASESIVRTAKEMFPEGIEHKILDITRDPRQQGFELHSFDLIIASNVLHSTSLLKESLRNIRQLLSRNGRFLLHELQPGVLSMNYILFYLIADWQAREEEGRLERSYLSPERWDQELRAAGFSGNEAISYDLDMPNQTAFTIISSAMSMPTTRNEITLLAGDSPGPWAKEVACRLGDLDYNVHWATLDQTPPANQCIISLLDLDGPYLHELSEQRYDALHAYLTKVETSKMIWVTKASQLTCGDPRFGLVFGLARSLRHEMALDISTFETDTFDSTAVDGFIEVLQKLERSRTSSDIDPEYEFSFYRGTVYTGRCHWALPQSQMPIVSSLQEAPRKLAIGSMGSVDTLYWMPFENGELTGNDIEVDMHYIGLNFRDVMVAMGLFGDPEEFGIEGSGIVRRVAPGVVDLKPGDRVTVLCPGAFRTRVVNSANLVTRLPDDISLEDAATMPCVYYTFILCLDILAHVREGESVLIHSACGGVGQAAIHVCKALGAQIFATVGNEEKVQYLISQFGIPRHRIFNSRCADFLPDIMRETNGRGVDVVLNSLAGKLLHASWQCVAPFGRMIELGKRDFLSNGHLNMAPMMQNRAFMGFDLTAWDKINVDAWKTVGDKYKQWYEGEKIIPIRPVKVYDATEVVDAFRYMQQGSHMGKILIRIPQDHSVFSLAKVKTPILFSPEASYLLVGGLGGLGRSISSWMVEQGARYLVYLSRSAGESERDQAFIRELRDQGCHAVCVAGSVVNMANVKSAISQCPKPIAGVIQLSTVLKDRTFNKMSYDEWTTCLETKVQGTWNLHKALTNEKLDFFVLFGSVSGVCGNKGQANYAAANGFLTSFTQYRRQLGLPASVLELGMVDEVGLASHNEAALQNAQSASLRLVYENELIEGLRLAIYQSRTPPLADSMMSSSCIIGLGNTKPLSDPGVRPLWTRDARFALYSNIESKSVNMDQTENNEVRILLSRIGQSSAYLKSPESMAIIRAALGKMIKLNMAHTQGMDDDELANVAIDSLMAIEMRNWIRRNMGLEISLIDIGKAGVVGKLAETIHELMMVKYDVKRGAQEQAAD